MMAFNWLPFKFLRYAHCSDMPYSLCLYVADISLAILIKSSSLLCVKHHASAWGTSEKWETSGMVPSPKC